MGQLACQSGAKGWGNRRANRRGRSQVNWRLWRRGAVPVNQQAPQSSKGVRRWCPHLASLETSMTVRPQRDPLDLHSISGLRPVPAPTGRTRVGLVATVALGAASAASGQGLTTFTVACRRAAFSGT